MIKTPYQSLKLKTKLLLILTGSVTAISIITGLYFDYFLHHNFLHTTEQRMEYAFHRFELHLKGIESDLKKGVAFTSDDEAFLASIELINGYQDKIHYNATLIDEEKKLLCDKLLDRVKLSLNDDIALYDSQRELIASVTKTPDGYYLSYVSFEAGNPVFYSRNENSDEYIKRPFKPYWLIPYKHVSFYTQKDISLHQVIITYHRFNNDLVVKSHKNLLSQNERSVIGHIEMSHFLSSSYYELLSTDLGMSIKSQSAAPLIPITSHRGKHTVHVSEQKDAFISASSIPTQNGVLYILASLDRSPLQSTLDNNRITFFSLITILTLFIVWIARNVFTRSIAQPLELLMGQIKKIESQDYTDSQIIRTGDELESISRNVLQLALTVQERENSLIASHQKLEHLSNTDPLTNLPNRRFFNAILERAIARSRRSQERLAVIFLDLDQFKQVNDTLGHNIGDQLLLEVAERLQRVLRSSDVLARIGGDEFNLLIEGLKDRSDIEPIVTKILGIFATPFVCADEEIRTTGSLGIAIFPEDGDSTLTLIKNADLAMYLSKEKGRNRFSFFSQKLANEIEEHSHKVHALKRALERGDEFFVLYQPKISGSTGKMIAIEALARWNSPELGMVSPLDFIPLAEETGMILPIGSLILATACRDFVQLETDGYALEHVAVNLSALQFQQDNFPQTIVSILENTGLKPEHLEIEITESFLLNDITHSIAVLSTFQSMGVSIAIDDFGTGYSSMSYLQKLPLNRLKIDKSFVDSLPFSEQGTAITRAIIGLARTFGLSITAEGVETEEQLHFLQQEGCDEIQGYYYAKPMTLTALKEFINNSR